MFQVRKTRNSLMHHPTMELTQTELSDVIQTMTDLLNDLHQRHRDPAIPPVVTEIQQVTIIKTIYFNNIWACLMYVCIFR